MDYHAKFGKIEQDLIKQTFKRTGKLPESVENAPELLPGLFLYLQAFFDLDSERAIGMATGPIPWSKIRFYGKELDLHGEQLERLHYLVSEMDSSHLSRINATQDKLTKKK